MCLYANKKNPLEGKYPIKFDEKGYTTCWKVYQLIQHYNHKALHPLYYACGGRVFAGNIKSKRGGHKGDLIKAGEHPFDILDKGVVNEGIHVYTSVHAAIREFSIKKCVIVPVRCHKNDLVAVDKDYCQAVFTQVFLDKIDHDKAVKG